MGRLAGTARYENTTLNLTHRDGGISLLTTLKIFIQILSSCTREAHLLLSVAFQLAHQHRRMKPGICLPVSIAPPLCWAAALHVWLWRSFQSNPIHPVRLTASHTETTNRPFQVGSRSWLCTSGRLILRPANLQELKIAHASPKLRRSMHTRLNVSGIIQST